MGKSKKKPSGTFIVRIMDYENVTWQGELVWAEKEKTQKFRSTLELLKLIDSAVGPRENNVGSALDGM